MSEVSTNSYITDMDETDSKVFWKCVGAKGYEMEDYLGKGRTCVVMKAWSEKDQNHVAVKIIDRSKVKTQYYEEKLPLELLVWNKMRHSNIIKLLDHISDTKWTYSIMEFFPGSDLEEWLLKCDQVVEDLGRRWLRQLACALHHLKKLGYAHGDVKPKNILVVRNKSIKVCDFSCLKPLNEGMCESYSGSMGYVAPEVFKKEPHDPEKADVWSYGVTGYILLTHGIVPKVRAAYVHRLCKNWSDHLPLNSQSLFEKVLLRRPDKRLNFDEILQHSWINPFQSSGDLPPPSGQHDTQSSTPYPSSSPLADNHLCHKDAPLKRKRPNFISCICEVNKKDCNPSLSPRKEDR